MLRPVATVSLCLFAAACSSAPLPEGAGRGVIAYDPAPPAGAKTYQRPTLVEGTRYALLRGGAERQDYAIVQANEQGLVLQDRSGRRVRRDADLGFLGEWNEEDEPVRLLGPADTRFHWPLWVGKRWRCEYAVLQAEVPPHQLEVSYLVEGLDRIEVPAGTFDALRIVRVAKIKAEDGPYLDQTWVTWYAPAIGFEVRQVISGTSFELVEWTVPTAEQAAR